jgi:hypothetical protein
MPSTFDMWNEKWSELMDDEGMEPEQANAAANTYVLRELNKRAKS